MSDEQEYVPKEFNDANIRAAREFKTQRDALVKSLEMIEYASRKDSLTDNERLQSVRTVVYAALSRVGADVGGPTK